MYRASNTERIVKLGTAHSSKTVRPSNHASIRLMYCRGLFSCFFTPQRARACFLVDLAKLFNHSKSLCPCISLLYTYLPMGSKTVRPSNTTNPPRRPASICLVYRARPFSCFFTSHRARACFLVDLAKLFNHIKSLCPCRSASEHMF